jgi:hypothetical protein
VLRAEEAIMTRTTCFGITMVICAVLAGCGGDGDGGTSDGGTIPCEGADLDVDDADTTEVRYGYEILQIVSPTEIRVWFTSDITQEQFDAIELPASWFKNNPLEGQADSGSFARSPDASSDGEFTFEEHFGYVWRHQATIVEINISLDESGLLRGSRVAKFHEITYHQCRTIAVLVSPEGETYIRVSRDPGRPAETSTLPAGWQQIDHLLLEDLVVQLPNPTLVIRTDIEDSFQGPVTGLDVHP